MKEKNTYVKRIMPSVIACIFWVIIWVILDFFIDDKVPFAGPGKTFEVLIVESHKSEFWRAVITTFAGLAGGYFVALIVGTILGAFAYFKPKFKMIADPFFNFFGYIPMISFTVASVIWLKGNNLFIPVAIFLAIPVVYKHTFLAFDKMNQRYINGVRKSNMKFMTKVRYLYRPSTMPEYIVGCHRGLLMCWKSGIIAQYLSDTGYSIGAHLFNAKEELDMASIFAWTIVIVILAKLFEFFVLALLSNDKLNHDNVTVGDIYDMVENDEVEL